MTRIESKPQERGISVIKSIEHEAKGQVDDEVDKKDERGTY